MSNCRELPLKAKILVVDDDPLVRMTTLHALEKCGYELASAEGGREALELVESLRPDIVLCDVMMPDMEGTEVCRRIKANPAYDGTHVILLSNLRTDSDSITKALEESADGYIARPVAARELQARVCAAVRVRNAEARLAELEKLAELGKVIGGIAHQFNNVNTVLVGHLTMLEMDRDLSASARRRVEQMRLALDREIEITEKLLQYARQRVFEPVRFDLSELVAQALCGFAERFETDDINVTSDLEANCDVQADRSLVKQVLDGVIDNAIHACAQRDMCQITVWARRDRQRVHIDIRDTGHGIVPEDLEQLFTPFFSRKGEHALKGSPYMHVRGVGLTLSVSRMILNAQGGEIVVSSEPNVGTNVRISLPAVSDVDDQQ